MRTRSWMLVACLAILERLACGTQLHGIRARHDVLIKDLHFTLYGSAADDLRPGDAGPRPAGSSFTPACLCLEMNEQEHPINVPSGEQDEAASPPWQVSACAWSSARLHPLALSLWPTLAMAPCHLHGLQHHRTLKAAHLPSRLIGRVSIGAPPIREMRPLQPGSLRRPLGGELWSTRWPGARSPLVPPADPVSRARPPARARCAWRLPG